MAIFVIDLFGYLFSLTNSNHRLLWSKKLKDIFLFLFESNPQILFSV